MARDGQAKSISAEVHDVHNFQSTLTAPCNILPRWRLGTPFIILFCSAKGEMNESMTR